MKRILPLLILLSVIFSSCDSPNEITITPTHSATPAVSSTGFSFPSPLPSASPSKTHVSSSSPTVLPVSSLVPEISNGCIVPPTIPAFQVGEGGARLPVLSDILPVGWSQESSMPDAYIQEIAGQGTRVLLRPLQGYDELWIYSYSDVIIYETNTQEWRQGPQKPAGELFLSKDGNIWAKVDSESKTRSILLRYNSTENNFEEIFDKNRILTLGSPYEVKVGNDGLFWLLINDQLNNKTLFSFDPNTLEAKAFIANTTYEGLEVDRNNNVYLMSGANTLVRFSPTTGKTTLVNIPSDFTSFGYPTSLYVDYQERLWVSDRVWLDLSHQRLNEWFFIVRSPVFIVSAVGPSENLWTRPEVHLESVDGLVWFMFSRGSVWFNPETGQWCLVTTYPARVIEDSQRNLWMFIDGTLYKREASQ